MIEFLPFSAHIIWLVALLLVLLVMSAMISGSETAFFSLSPSQINTLHGDNSRKSKAALRLLEHQDALLSAILITNNLINIGAILVANSIIDGVVNFGESQAMEFVVKIIIVTFILLLFGEIMPKIFAAYNSYAFARLMSMPITALRVAFSPLSFLLTASGRVITRSLSKNQPNVSMNELQNAIEITDTETPEDKKMLTGIVRFVNTEVDEIMKPRIDVVALNIEQKFDAVCRTVIDSGFSRIPVYEDSFDHINGVLYVKDLLPYISQENDFNWQKLLRKPYFVPEHKKINDLLEDFQTKKIHLAIVVDEYGGTLGIVTLEDILEEVVGEISDESDVAERSYLKIDNHSYIFEGKTHIGDFLRLLELPETLFDKAKGDADTLAGLLLEVKGDFLKKGDEITLGALRFKAHAVDGYRITKIYVHIIQ